MNSVWFRKMSLNSLQLQFSHLNNRGNVFYIIKRCFREVEYLISSTTSPWKRKAIMNSLMKYVLHFATHWQFNKTLLLPFPASSPPSSPQGSARCQRKSHLSDIFEVRNMVRRWEISYPKGRKKSNGEAWEQRVAKVTQIAVETEV